MTGVDVIADELHVAVLSRFPVLGTLRGIPGYDDQLTDYREEADERFAAVLEDIAKRADAIDPEPLTRTDRVTRTMIGYQASALRDQVVERWVEFTVSDLISTPVPIVLHTLDDTPSDAERQRADYEVRLSRLPAFFGALAQRHRDGIRAGRLPVARLVRAAIAQLDGKAELPGVREYRDALAADVLPHGREDDRAGVCWLPDGEQLYASAARRHTTTGRTADELHRMGLEVLDGLAAEYATLGKEVFGTSDVSEVFTRLQNGPRWRDGAEMVAAARAIVRKAEAAAPQWFRQVPEEKCVVRTYPDGTPAATPPSYLMGAVDGSRPGTYSVNPAQLSGKHNAEALAFHEAVPGHHFDGATRMARTDLSVWRRTAGVSAFAEGWALYAERLADEMGLYSDSLARLGMLTFDSMRAGRLVVDTGLHAFGWSRARAVEFLLANTPMAPDLVESEVDRYLANPGQALAYMVGRLEIQRLRRDAETRLGDAFDVRDFHEVVLSEARVPLSTLADLVEEWIQSLIRRR
ncbi:hypothetical protein ALI22I_34195 [Saccharothrix sp. ALI-22-I]|uniref:DUF885 domain-containing protein n=1 Tax=Saccharothrix sp. ALI-22-I TaxID=1933778 RepID=UPI00097BFF18|nr:DUF885 domain-containing protein [Saccharothrix sp. ALI-22-I]ONI83541.1 hypothetical protein ALI22I_34195 [Saccharothrix sp. ALI-22-I]